MEERLKKVRMRNTWVEIDLDAIASNLHEARRIIPADTRIAAVLKGNAYGHGAVQVARTLIENKVDQLAVACLSEALELRKHFTEVPILVMGYTPDEYLSVGVKNRVVLTIFSLEQARKISDIAGQLKEKAVIHIKLDTGLNRLGMKPGPKAEEAILNICRLSNIHVEGIYSHLALTAEEADRVQFSLFMDTISRIEARGVHIPIKHISDSNGMVLYPSFDLDMVRLGGFIFGVTTSGLYKDIISLRPAMTFKTQITRIEAVRRGECVGYDPVFVAPDECRIGTIAVGYTDGYVRGLSDKGEVSIRGKRAPVIGIICMDQCMVNLTDIPEAELEDEVLLFGTGRQDFTSVNELAGKVDTNRNEILSNIGRRVPRVYIKDSQIIDVVDYLLD
ncbi:MAG TPA: alanine racemase [Candidatus Nitrosocosmicus sp.]|nr:alanine racemase [Candidatus Nitrosocosmicus sp.]